MNHKKKAERDFGTFSSKAPDMEAAEDLADFQVCSATECTGLIPALPKSNPEITSYEELYHFLPRAKG